MNTYRILPELRSLISSELYYEYKWTQKEIAALLGVTQSAVSQYMQHIRGNITFDDIPQFKNVMTNIKIMCKMTHYKEMTASEFIVKLRELSEFLATVID